MLQIPFLKSFFRIFVSLSTTFWLLILMPPFEIILFDIEKGNNEITISAMDSEGKRKELSFVISAN